MRCSLWPHTRDKRLDWQDQNWGVGGGEAEKTGRQEKTAIK